MSRNQGPSGRFIRPLQRSKSGILRALGLPGKLSNLLDAGSAGFAQMVSVLDGAATAVLT